MRYLLDTDWIVDYLTGQETAQALLTELLPGGIALSIISFSEIYEGIYTSRDPLAAERAFRAFLERVTLLGLTRSVAKRNAQLRGELRRQRRQLTHRAFDIVIAATALTYNLTLVTRNRRDYEDILDLKLYPFS